MDKHFSKFELRFEKFDKAITNLGNRISLLSNNEIKEYNDALRESVIQCHETAIELLWKTLKDYLIEQDKSIQINYSKETIKVALKTNIIEDENIAYVLLEAIDNRNISSHEYFKEEDIDSYVNTIINTYFREMNYMRKRLMKNEEESKC